MCCLGEVQVIMAEASNSSPTHEAFNRCNVLILEMARLISSFHDYVTIGMYLGLDPEHVRSVFYLRDAQIFEASWILLHNWFNNLPLEGQEAFFQSWLPDLKLAFSKIGKEDIFMEKWKKAFPNK